MRFLLSAREASWAPLITSRKETTAPGPASAGENIEMQVTIDIVTTYE